MNREEFKTKLKEYGKSQKDMAIELGISSQQITNWNREEKYAPYIKVYFKYLQKNDEAGKLKKKVELLNHIINE